MLPPQQGGQAQQAQQAQQSQQPQQAAVPRPAAAKPMGKAMGRLGTLGAAPRPTLGAAGSGQPDFGFLSSYAQVRGGHMLCCVHVRLIMVRSGLGPARLRLHQQLCTGEVLCCDVLCACPPDHGACAGRSRLWPAGLRLNQQLRSGEGS